jgi:hypothetical protein
MTPPCSPMTPEFGRCLTARAFALRVEPSFAVSPAVAASIAIASSHGRLDYSNCLRPLSVRLADLGRESLPPIYMRGAKYFVRHGDDHRFRATVCAMTGLFLILLAIHPLAAAAALLGGLGAGS